MEFHTNKEKVRKIITIIIIILVLSILEPFLLLLILPYGIFAYKKIRLYKSKKGKNFDESIEEFLKGNYEKSLELIEETLDEKEFRSEALRIKAQCYYSMNNYQEFIKTLELIPEKELDDNLTLMMAKGQCLEKLGFNEDAKIVYEGLSKKFPKSKFLKEKLGEL